MIGSDHWAAENPSLDIDAAAQSPLPNAAGWSSGICAGTLALARAGLLQEQNLLQHGRDWILHHLPAIRGRDVPHAVAEACG